MQLWEWVIAYDRRTDLTDPAAAIEFFVAHRMNHFPLPLKWDADRPPWPKSVFARWVKNVHTLRSLAARLKNRRTQPTVVEPLDADQVFAAHLSRLTLMINRADDGDGSEPLRASTFTGVSLSFGVVSTTDYPELDRVFAMLSSVQDAFWRMVFGSLATDELPPVCAAPGCGKPLEPTPSGRTPRVPKCKKCRYDEWYRAQPKTKLRARWARNKRNERNANKESGS